MLPLAPVRVPSARPGAVAGVRRRFVKSDGGHPEATLTLQPALMLEPWPDVFDPFLRGSRLERDGIFVYALSGELDMAGADAFVARLATLIDNSPGPVVLDLEDLRFVDSAGLRALLRVRDMAAVYDRRVVLRAVGSSVQKIIDLLEVGPAFDYEP